MRSTITFAFTTYNAQKTIESSLISALNQTYAPSEIIVYDDASSDSTTLIVDQILSNSIFPYRIIYGHTNRGVGYARKTIVESCTTDYLAFFDDDDSSFPQRISEQLMLLFRYESFYPDHISPLCYSNRVVNTHKGESFECAAISINRSKVCMNRALLALLSCRPLPSPATSGSTATCTLTCKTSTLLMVGNFNTTLRRFEDLDIAVRAVKAGVSLISVPKLLVSQNYRHTFLKSRSYRYNLKLNAYHKSSYPEKSDYRFAALYIMFKNHFLQGDFFDSIYFFLLMVSKNPFLSFIMIANSMSTFRFSLPATYGENLTK